MDNFKAVCKILTAIEKAMDLPEFDINQIGHEALGVSKERWARYIEMMVDAGYIKGVGLHKNTLGETIVNCNDMRCGKGTFSLAAPHIIIYLHLFSDKFAKIS